MHLPTWRFHFLFSIEFSDNIGEWIPLFSSTVSSLFSPHRQFEWYFSLTFMSMCMRWVLFYVQSSCCSTDQDYCGKTCINLFHPFFPFPNSIPSDYLAYRFVPCFVFFSYLLVFFFSFVHQAMRFFHVCSDFLKENCNAAGGICYFACYLMIATYRHVPDICKSW